MNNPSDPNQQNYPCFTLLIVRSKFYGHYLAVFDVGHNNGRQGLLDRCLRDKTIRIILITLNYNKFKRTIRNNAKKKKQTK